MTILLCGVVFVIGVVAIAALIDVFIDIALSIKKKWKKLMEKF